MSLGNGPEGDLTLSSRILYWAGSYRSSDRDELTEFCVSDRDDLIEVITKLACVQAMDQHGINPNPMDAPIEPNRLHPLVKGLPGILRGVCEARRESIEKELQESIQTGGSSLHHTTWGELLEELVAKGQTLGYSDSTPLQPSFPKKKTFDSKSKPPIASHGKKQEERHVKVSGRPESLKGSPRTSPRSSPRGSPETNRRSSSGIFWGQSPYYGQGVYLKEHKYGVKARDLIKGNPSRVEPMKAELNAVSKTMSEMKKLLEQALKGHDGDKAGKDHKRGSRTTSPNKSGQSDQQGAKGKSKN
ncbi:uncharacterized protein LOC135173781 [Pogoniulus pusillus]|uniref:uncharacterized protein LOC135173781 n=1 Tax=Pogoniulus pusillus TaxID=488313 RepID=UPI0030B99783